MKNRLTVITALLLITAGLFADPLALTAYGCVVIPPTDEDGYWDGYRGELEADEDLADILDLYNRSLVKLITGKRAERLEAAGDWGFETDAILYGPPDLLDPLLMWLDTEPDAWITASFLMRISGVLHRSLQPVFQRALDHPDDGVRSVAFYWYGQVRDDQAVPRLERLWSDTPIWSRGRLLAALARQGSTRHLDKMVELACKYDAGGDPDIRSEAAIALSLVRDKGAIPCLSALATGEAGVISTGLRQRVMHALRDYGDFYPAREALLKVAMNSEDPMRSDAADGILAAEWPAETGRLREAALDPLESVSFRIQVLGMLGMLNDGHIPIL